MLTGAKHPLTVQEIGDELARDGRGMPLKKRTIQVALADLKDAGMAVTDADIGGAYVWRAHQGENEAADAF